MPIPPPPPPPPGPPPPPTFNEVSDQTEHAQRTRLRHLATETGRQITVNKLDLLDFQFIYNNNLECLIYVGLEALRVLAFLFYC